MVTCGAGAWSARHWRAALELSSISCRWGEGHSALRHSAKTILPSHLLKGWQHSHQQAQIAQPKAGSSVTSRHHHTTSVSVNMSDVTNYWNEKMILV